MKYKVGDKVIVREDLEVGNFYGHYFNKEMAELKGKVVEIKDIGSNSYYIKESGCFWTSEMFSGLAEEPRNLIPLIAKELGVEVGEEFYLRENFENDTNMNIYKFVEDGLKLNTKYGWEYVTLLDELIAGKYTIQKLPKKPKLTEAERVILENLPKEYTHIQRYKYDLIVYDDDDGTDIKYLNMFSHLFQFIKWEDKEPYKIQELLEEYENLRSE